MVHELMSRGALDSARYFYRYKEIMLAPRLGNREKVSAQYLQVLGDLKQGRVRGDRYMSFIRESEVESKSTCHCIQNYDTYMFPMFATSVELQTYLHNSILSFQTV